MSLLPSSQASLFKVRTSQIEPSERLIAILLAIASAIPLCAIVTLSCVFIGQSWLFFQQVPLANFLTDRQWAPSFEFRQRYGILVLISATLMVSTIAMVVAIPVGVLSAIYLSECAPEWFRSIIRPLRDSLSGVPTVIYGYFAVLFLTPRLQLLIPSIAFYNGLSAGLVTGLLITPIISSLSEDALRSIDKAHRQAAYACGLTRFEMIWTILLPEAFPGIMAAIMLAASRALGETMIAAIAAGQNPTLTLNPLVSIETMTGFIVHASLGFVPTNDIKFQTIFTVGMVLFLITLVLNSVGAWLVYRYRRTMEGQTLPTADRRGNRTLAYPVLSARRFAQATFLTAIFRRRCFSQLFTTAGLLASLMGPGFLALLAIITLRLGLPQLNAQFIFGFPSSVPREAGILAPLVATFWLLGLTVLLAVPIGIAAAVFLEEYLPQGSWNRVIQVSIANAAAVPGILYGLLGAALFAEALGGLTGGRSILAAALTMTLLVLPLLITSSRAALQQVPMALKQAAYAVGMSRWQVIWHIVLPTACPRLLTGALLSASRIVGETSPLLAIGAVGFVTFVPRPTLEGLQSPFTTLTTQIFFWLSSSQAILQQKAAAAVVVLGTLVLIMNSIVALLRDRLQHKL